jgi:hypothetical protein
VSEQEGRADLQVEALGRALEEAGLEPIDVVDKKTKLPPAAAALKKLRFADAQKAKIVSGVPTQIFDAVQKLERPDADADDLNNLGCAWALLAYLQKKIEYWPRAEKALEGSKAHEGANREQQKRAEANLEHVRTARLEAEFD